MQPATTPIRAIVIACDRLALSQSLSLFQDGYPLYSRPLARLRELQDEINADFRPLGAYPDDDVDVAIFLNLPADRSVYDALRSRFAKAKTILVAFETPRQRYLSEPKVLGLFDAVVTYDKSIRAHNVFYFNLPYSPGVIDCAERGFGERRFALMVATNYDISGLSRIRRLLGDRLKRRPHTSWPVASGTAVRSEMGAIARQKVVSASERQPPEQRVDVFGKGWSGARSGRAMRCIPRRRYRSAKGPLEGGLESVGETMCRYRFYIAVENYIGNRNYVSEKIFHAIRGGGVPVYLGDAKIVDKFPANSLVNARVYSSWEQLLFKLSNMSESEWLTRRQSCRETYDTFLKTTYSDDQFATAVLSATRFTASLRLR